jgi:hypothetical protein
MRKLPAALYSALVRVSFLAMQTACSSSCSALKAMPV